MAAEVDTTEYERVKGKHPEAAGYQLWTFRNIATDALFHTSGKWRAALVILREEQNRLRKNINWEVQP